MNYLKYKKGVIIWFVITLALALGAILLGIFGSNPNWGVTFAEQFKNTLGLITDSFNIGLWGTAGYATPGSIVTFILVLLVVGIIIGWFLWISRTRRFTPFIYICLLVVTTFLVLHYSENFFLHFEGELAAGNIVGILVTIVTALLIISMLILMVFSYLYDYHYLYTGEPVEEVIEVVEEKLVIVEEKKVVTVVEEVIIHKTIVEEEVVEEDIEIIEEYIDDDDDGAVKGDRKLRVPFALKLKKATPEIREAYNEIKAYFLSYGFNSRISIAADTFRLHTKTYAKLQISGKSIRINFALDPNDYLESTIPVIDSGNQKIYEEIPLTFKVKSNLSVKRAKILIDAAAEVDGLPREFEEVHADYSRQAIATLKRSPYYLKHFNGQ